MSLNVTFAGYVYLENNTLANSNVYFQALWYPNGTASSPTTWSDVRLCENTGYWSINGGDALWLSQDGVMLANGKVIIVFWKGFTTDRNSNCLLIEQWGATEITLTNASVYTLNTQIKSNISPVLAWTLPASAHFGFRWYLFAQTGFL